jgi:hypothetical protein
MNRIYQGKASNVQIQKLPSSEGPGVGKAKKGKKPEPEWVDLPDWQSALWQHHTLFQDAVNF